jgi:hypothetical protein
LVFFYGLFKGLFGFPLPLLFESFHGPITAIWT